MNASGDVEVKGGFRITYAQQSWAAYDEAQTGEKELFMKLYRELCAGIPQPKQGRALALSAARAVHPAHAEARARGARALVAPAPAPDPAAGKAAGMARARGCSGRELGEGGRGVHNCKGDAISGV